MQKNNIESKQVLLNSQEDCCYTWILSNKLPEITSSDFVIKILSKELSEYWWSNSNNIWARSCQNIDAKCVQYSVSADKHRCLISCEKKKASCIVWYAIVHYDTQFSIHPAHRAGTNAMHITPAMHAWYWLCDSTVLLWEYKSPSHRTSTCTNPICRIIMHAI